MGNEELVKWFLSNGATIHHDNTARAVTLPLMSSTYLNCAARSASIATIDLLIENGADQSESIPLHCACNPSSRSDEECVLVLNHLIRLGFDVNASDESLIVHALGPPLNHAIRSQSILKVQCLLENGADVHLSRHGKLAPVHFADSEFRYRSGIAKDPHKSKQILQLLTEAA